MSEQRRTDVLIVGAGAAGLACAVAARQRGASVTVVCKGTPGRGGATAKAGGIVNAALGIADPTDSPEAHVRDMVLAGRFLCEEPQAWAMAEGIIRELPRLLACGVRFVEENGQLVQIRQPGHRHARTLCLPNNRGTDLGDPLLATARRLGVEFVSGLSCVELLVRDGAAVGAAFLAPRSGEVAAIAARAVVLATGGAGLYFEATGIPALTPGDGYALALQAGCSLLDLEFVQFFPVSLVEADLPHGLLPYDYLLSRGAVFRNTRGEDIAARHRLPEPAMITRAQLAGAIGREIVAGHGLDGAVLLDCSGFRPDYDEYAWSRHRFAQLVLKLRAEGRDILASPLRVMPVVHHFMGGVRVNPHGETEVPNLLACGEAAGGTHGANRLAANAFTEAISSGFRAGERAVELAGSGASVDLGPDARRVGARVRERLLRHSDVRVDEIVAGLRRALSEGAGTCRDRASLEAAGRRLAELAAQAETAQARNAAERGLAPNLAGLVRVAGLLVEAALRREESRGAHVRSDFVDEDDRFLHHIAHRAGGSSPYELPVARSGLDWSTWRDEPEPAAAATGDRE